MEAQTFINIGIIMLMLAGFTTVIVLNDDGIELRPTHYCESRELKMYCARTTAQYCRPSNTTTRGSKQCVEGWELIPVEVEPPLVIKKPGGSGGLVCDFLYCW